MLSEKIQLNSTAYMQTYIPDRITDHEPLRPTVIVFPGGGYGFLSPREGECIALKFNSFGMNAVVVYYEINTHYPAPLINASDAVVYARSNVSKWHGDASKIVVCGFSAGAHLAASISTLWNKEPSIMHDDKMNRPDAMILSYPVISGGEYAHRASFDNIGATSDELIKRYSADLNVDSETPPAFIWHTFADAGVPLENSMLMAQAMRKNNIPFELHIFPEGCHGLSLADKSTSTSDEMVIPHIQHWVYLAKEWIENYI